MKTLHAPVDMTEDPPVAKGPVATVKSVLDMVLARKHAVENNGRDPAVLAVLSGFERRLFAMMKAAEHHGGSAVDPTVLTEAELATKAEEDSH